MFVLDVLLKIDRDHVAVALGKRMRSVSEIARMSWCYGVASLTTSPAKGLGMHQMLGKFDISLSNFPEKGWRMLYGC